MKRGVAGVVTDGGFRDSPEVARLAIPAYHCRPSAPANLTVHQAIDINVPIGCGDAPVFPGDVIVGDGEGVVVIPARGRSILGLYPATDPQTQVDFAAWRKANKR
jgi:regulator of RNase E activity RraA